MPKRQPWNLSASKMKKRVILGRMLRKLTHKLAPRPVAEALSLCPAKRLEELNRGSISNMELIELLGNARRQLSASTFGMIINTILAVPAHFFAVGAGINMWQTAVNVINFRRIKKEIKLRVKQYPDLQPLFARAKGWNKVVKDIFWGIFIKSVFTVLALGLSGFENIFHAFADLSHLDHAHHWLSMADATNSKSEVAAQGVLHAKSVHHQLAHFDHVFHSGNAGAADSLNDKLNHAFLPAHTTAIGVESSHSDLSYLHRVDGVSVGHIAVVGVTSAAAGELVQPLSFAGEKGAEKLFHIGSRLRHR